MVQVDNKIYLFGGRNAINNRFFNDLWEFEMKGLDTNSHENITSVQSARLETSGQVGFLLAPLGSPNHQKPSPRSGCLFTNFEKTLIVYGGLTGTEEATRDQVFCLSLEEMIWTRVRVANSNRQFSNFTFQKQEANEILIFGGQDFNR